ncbi:ATP-binding protein [Kitasatospora sp. NPDC048540]|uniref:ATP-binding protein n=1 Tax=unclassified Kitasatospora TaxID=2633591 RepID=UPI000689C134|nr:ATP-binding protein [Kitasatospora sp. MBT63]
MDTDQGTTTAAVGAASALRPGPVRRLALSGRAGAIGRSRDHAASVLREWGWLPADDAQRRARTEDVLLVVSELVTNACRHAGGAAELVIAVAAHTLRIEVTDLSPAAPAPLVPMAPPTPPAPAAQVPARIPPQLPGRPGGYGLRAVAMLASRWGCTPGPDASGKVVWAELELPGLAAGPAHMS